MWVPAFYQMPLAKLLYSAPLEPVFDPQLILKEWMRSCIDARDCHTVMALCRLLSRIQSA